VDYGHSVGEERLARAHLVGINETKRDVSIRQSGQECRRQHRREVVSEVTPTRRLTPRELAEREGKRTHSPAHIGAGRCVAHLRQRQPGARGIVEAGLRIVSRFGQEREVRAHSRPRDDAAKRRERPLRMLSHTL